MLEYLRRLFHYDAWANEQALRACEAAAADGVRAMQLMAHIVAAEWLWLKRLGQGKTMAVWPDLNAQECAREQRELETACNAYLSGLSEAALGEIVAYINSKGERWTNTRIDVLMHLIMHSAYHRGQIAAELRRHGHEPAYTDFIEAVRKGFVP